jgi:glycerol-3-phosphate dehydrogenase
VPCLQILYFDGQFNDARLNVALACSAAAAGATVLNYAEVKKLIKAGGGQGLTVEGYDHE